MTTRTTCGLCFALVALLEWVSHWSFPLQSAPPVLDPSHAQAMGVALREGLQWGRDLVFTYGPLGWFWSSPYDAGLYWPKCIVWELGLGAGVALLLATPVLRLGSWWERALFALVLVLPRVSWDAQAMLAIVAGAAWIFERLERGPVRRRDGVALAALLLGLGCFALVKFTFLLLFVVAALALAVGLGAARGWRAGLACLALFALALVLEWCALGQGLVHLPAWIAGGLELTRGYGTAMALDSTPGTLVPACVALLACGLALVGSALERPAGALRWSWCVLLIAGSFLAFKSGLVRGQGTERTIFVFLAVAPFLAASRAPATRARVALATRALRVIGALACFVGFAQLVDAGGGTPAQMLGLWRADLAHNLKTVAGLADYRRELEAQRAELVREHAAPRIRAEVGRETVDVFGAEQAAAFLNGLNWHPRPVFQAYAAFTPALSERNARFLAGENAPRYVLLRVATIDQRLPGMDDASSLAVLARDYEALLEENGFLLLRRRADAPRQAIAAQLLRQAQLAYGERLELDEGPGGPLRLELELPARPADGLRASVWKAEPVWLELALSDGRTVVHRVLPEMLRAGVLLEPWLEDHDAWIRWLAAGERVSVRALRVLPPAAGRPGGAITARILVAPGLAPPVAAERRDALLWPMFDRAPLRCEGARPAVRRLLRNRTDVLTVFAPSQLEFELGAGHWRLEAGYGILPAALLVAPSDGVRFEIRVEGAQQLLGRVLDPVRIPADAETQSFAAELELRAPARLILVTDPIGNPASDWAYWSLLRCVSRP